MARLLYSFLFYLITPAVLLRLLYRAWKAPEYSKRWAERFGFFGKPALKSPIWIHAVSVGETIAAAPLIKELQARHPERDIVVTTMTPTGSDRVTSLFGDSVFHVYAPYDLPGAVKRFLKKIDPAMLIIMETELWPNLIHYSATSDVPVILANARLSERSAKGYCRVGFIARPMLNQLSRVVAQNRAAAERFRMIGIAEDRVSVSGSIKFDFMPEPSLVEQGSVLRAAFGAERPVWVAASTHQGEDLPVLEAHREVLSRHPNALLILVPRHPERFDDVYRLCLNSDFNVVRRSSGECVSADTHVILGDTMGELVLFYAASDVAFVGGSLVESGGHNPLEPAALKLPVIMGPHVFNFEDICHQLSQAGGLKFIGSTVLLAERVNEFFEDPSYASRVGVNACEVVKENRGALDRLTSIIDEYLS